MSPVKYILGNVNSLVKQEHFPLALKREDILCNTLGRFQDPCKDTQTEQAVRARELQWDYVRHCKGPGREGLAIG